MAEFQLFASAVPAPGSDVWAQIEDGKIRWQCRNEDGSGSPWTDWITLEDYVRRYSHVTWAHAFDVALQDARKRGER